MLRSDPFADSQSAEFGESQSCYFNLKGCEFLKTLLSALLYPSTMANQQQRPWFLELVPFLVILLIAAHVFALVYWIYRLAVDKGKEKDPRRRKAH